MVMRVDRADSTSQDDDGSEGIPAHSRRLNAPQIPAQRLKNTLQAKGAWRQVARGQDLCDTHMSHKWLFHLYA